MENPDVLEYDEEEMETEMMEMTKTIEFFYKQCPMDNCEAKLFENRTKFQRHWEEKHTSVCIKYECSISGCQASCRRKHDIKIHLMRQHYFSDKKLLQSALEKCKKIQQDNRGFIDPGYFVYRNRVLSTTSTPSSINQIPLPVSSVSPGTSSASPTLNSTQQIASPSVNSAQQISSPTPSVTVISSILAANPTDDDEGPDFTVSVPEKFPTGTSKISLTDHKKRSHPPTTTTVSIDRNYNTSFGYSAKAFSDNSSQSSCIDYPPIQLPAIPENETDLSLYLLFLSNSMDSLGRTRLVAKERLETIRKEGSKLEQARKKRRELEVENRRLRTELADMKWKDLQLFRDMEP